MRNVKIGLLGLISVLLAEAKSQKERNDIQEYWLSVDREQEAELINKIENEYYQNASYRNNPNLYSLIRKHIHQYKEKIGAVNSTYGFIYKYYNSDGREVNHIIIRGTKEYKANLFDKPKFLSFNHSEILKNSNNSEFVWTKDDLGKSVAQNVLSEVGNQPWVGYVHYAEKASKFARTVSRTGGPVLIGYLAKDLYMDYQVYSGRELVKAWGADLIPVATGLGGGLVGSGAGPVGAFAVGFAGATFGDRIKDEIKFNLKRDVDK